MLPIVYINLDSHLLRRELMEAEFARLGLVGGRLSATLWSRLDADEQDRLYSAAMNRQTHYRPLANGEKGCYASHLRAWQGLLDSEEAALVVLEDDVVLHDDFGAIIEAIGKQLRAGRASWDMIKLMGRSSHRHGSKPNRTQPLMPGYELYRYSRIPSSTAGYVISREGAKKLLSKRIPFGRPVDVDLRNHWESSVRIWGLSPDAIHIDSRSDASSLGLSSERPDLASRWKKFRLKLHYNLLNFIHRT